MTDQNLSPPLGLRQRRDFDSTEWSALRYQVIQVNVPVAGGGDTDWINVGGSMFFWIAGSTGLDPSTAQAVAVKLGKNSDWIKILIGDTIRCSPVEVIKFRALGGPGIKTITIIHSNDPRFDYRSIRETAGVVAASADRGNWTQ